MVGLAKLAVNNCAKRTALAMAHVCLEHVHVMKPSTDLLVRIAAASMTVQGTVFAIMVFANVLVIVEGQFVMSWSQCRWLHRCPLTYS